MRISFIGAGRLASQLAIALAQNHTIQHIYSRDLSKAQRLAWQVKAVATNAYTDLQAACDLIIIAVSDRAIADVIAAVHAHAPEALIVHTSGSTAMSVLSAFHPRVGVFTPCKPSVLNAPPIGHKRHCCLKRPRKSIYSVCKVWPMN